MLTIHVVRSICGAITLADTVPTLSIRDSIIDADVQAIGTDVALQTSTLLGAVHAHSLDADASIFVEPVTVARQQIGCLRFCYVPIGSHTPRRYRCQPDLQLAEQVGTPPVRSPPLPFTPSPTKSGQAPPPECCDSSKPATSGCPCRRDSMR
ncbi:MAG: hypothetical protein HC881_19645 [Leptolyngbyaceae cyanobacterium SL_7_1]|nr:hypothetical protein [Leptolyngbyaceae cyanobacterium SL_7_1]